MLSLKAQFLKMGSLQMVNVNQLTNRICRYPRLLMCRVLGWLLNIFRLSACRKTCYRYNAPHC